MRIARRRTAAVLLLGVSLFAAACNSGGDNGGGTKTDEKVELTFWTWVPNIDKVVEKWNSTHPNIHVTASKQAQGDEEVTKLLTAAKAGSPPDLAQVEYQALPTLVSNDVLADIKDKVGNAKSDFADGVWQTVTLGSDAVYAIPQDVGPMMLYYREDLFKKYGLTVPKTWEEFAATARAARKKAPKSYLTTFSSGDPGWFVGLAQQAGASWWGVNGDTWSVSVNDPATKKVTDYWSGLVAEGVVDSKPMYTPEWNKSLNDGTLLAWPSAIWGPGVLAGNAADTKGKWAMAPLPQWVAGENKTGSWGGSTTAVTEGSKHKDAAAQFAVWLNTDPEAVAALVREGGIYPASKAAQAGPALATAPDFFPNQPDFYVTAKGIADTAAGFTFGPNVNVAYSAYKDAFAKAIADKAPFGGALDTMQTTTLDDLKKAGFKVAG
ncbi:extracellular solute-binding protein [Luedemannella flava]|uniref:Extracellular solute-binding protein n=1 Tax=Luedemannella flava TaxID=349316 RepID=A0ABP4YA96_9ACTN